MSQLKEIFSRMNLEKFENLQIGANGKEMSSRPWYVKIRTLDWLNIKLFSNEHAILIVTNTAA